MKTNKTALFTALTENLKSGLILQVGMAQHALSLSEKPSMASVSIAFGLSVVPTEGTAEYHQINYQQKVAAKYFALFDSQEVKEKHGAKLVKVKALFESLDLSVEYRRVDTTAVKQFAMMEGFVLKTGADLSRCLFDAFKTKPAKPLTGKKPTVNANKAAPDAATVPTAQAAQEQADTVVLATAAIAEAMMLNDGIGKLLAELNGINPAVALIKVVEYHRAEMARMTLELEAAKAPAPSRQRQQRQLAA